MTCTTNPTLAAQALDEPLSEADARAASVNGEIEAVVVLDVIALINAKPHQVYERVVGEVLVDRWLARAYGPTHILGDAPGAHDDPRRHPMYVQVRIALDDP